MATDMQQLEARLCSTKIQDLDIESINRIGGVMAVIDHPHELHPDATLVSLVPMWISEKAKGVGANAHALEQIESVIIQATAAGRTMAKSAPTRFRKRLR